MFNQIFNIKFQFLIFLFSIAKFAVSVVGIDNIDYWSDKCNKYYNFTNSFLRII
jgi:hypothetical protein